jgi:hypothetical protein
MKYFLNIFLLLFCFVYGLLYLSSFYEANHFLIKLFFLLWLILYFVVNKLSILPQTFALMLKGQFKPILGLFVIAFFRMLFMFFKYPIGNTYSDILWLVLFFVLLVINFGVKEPPND